MNSTAFRSWVSASRFTPLARWLAFLAALATLAALQAVVFPRWPRAKPLPQQHLLASVQRADSQAKPLTLPEKERQASRSHDLAVSETLAFRFGDGEELRVLRGTSRERAKFAIDTFTAKRPELKLRNSTLSGPPARTSGVIQGRPALQTCLVALSPVAQGFGVDAAQLAPLVDQAAQGREAALRRILGLQDNRDYSCVLISLRSGNAGPVSLTRWNQLVQVLPAALLPQASTKAAPANGNPS